MMAFSSPPPSNVFKNSKKSATDDDATAPPSTTTRRQRLRERMNQVGTSLQKFNLGKLIDNMEKDQELADKLEFKNREMEDEAMRMEIVRQATEQCRANIREHLHEFLPLKPTAVYEEWIQDLHPDNVHEGALFQDLHHIDHRFYVPDSDHLIMWNEHMQHIDPARIVKARIISRKRSTDDNEPPLASSAPVDLFDTTTADVAITANDEDGVLDLFAPAASLATKSHDHASVDLFEMPTQSASTTTTTASDGLFAVGVSSSSMDLLDMPPMQSTAAKPAVDPVDLFGMPPPPPPSNTGVDPFAQSTASSPQSDESADLLDFGEVMGGSAATAPLAPAAHAFFGM